MLCRAGGREAQGQEQGRGRAHILLSATWSFLMPEGGGHVEEQLKEGKSPEENIQELSEPGSPIPPVDTGGWS